MKSKIEIIHVVQVAGNSRKTGNAYDIRNAQCVVRDADPKSGQVAPKIGVLSLPDRFKDVARGVYMVEFDAGVNQQGRIVSEVADMKPWDATSANALARLVKVEILSVQPLQGFSKKSLKDYDMRIAQCIVHKADRQTGEVSMLVGELLLPEAFKDTQSGIYDVEFEISISQDKRIGGRVVDMKPHGHHIAKSNQSAAQVAAQRAAAAADPASSSKAS